VFIAVLAQSDSIRCNEKHNAQEKYTRWEVVFQAAFLV